MSLFKLRSIWSTNHPQQQFDAKHLTMGKICNTPCIILGSFKGSLRIYSIKSGNSINVNKVFEKNHQMSIIDVKMVLHPDERIKGSTIGVLFYRKFCYYSFTIQDGNFEGRPMWVDVQPSFGILSSPIAVTTLNFSIQYLNPLHNMKLKVSDSIYPYTTSMEKFYFADGQQLIEIQGSTEQWRIVVGRMRQIFAINDTIIVIGERAIWEIQNAKIIKTKALQEQISSGTVILKEKHQYNLIIGNFIGQLLVYNCKYELLWAMKVDYVPLRVIVCEQEGIRGLMVILNEEGALQLAYSGTQTPEAVVQPLSENVDMEVVRKQTRKFMARMDEKPEKQKNTSVVQNHKKVVSINISAPEKSFENHEIKSKLFQFEGKIMKCNLVCQVTTLQSFSSIKIQIRLPSNLCAKDTIKEIRNPKRGNSVSFSIYTSNQYFPYDALAKVTIRYEDGRSTQLYSEQVHIPMNMQSIVSQYDPPSQKLPNHIIIKSTSQFPSFNTLFPELVSPNQEQHRKSIQFTLANGVKCSITYNKGFNKAKIQCEFYSGLCYIICQFTMNVKKKKIQLSVEIPLEQFFGIMKEHYDMRNQINQAFNQLETKSIEFREVQKKLLIKMKQKTTTLSPLDKLLDFTYQRLLESSSNYESVLQKQEIINHNLAVSIKLIIELLFIRANPSEKAKKIALGILGYEKESKDYGWQQKVMKSSSYFLGRKWKDQKVNFEQLQKIPLYVISKVNNGDWN